MRSQNAVTKMATSFMAEPLKSYDMLYRAASGLRHGVSGARKAALGAAAAYVLSNVATALAASAWDAMRDDDREKDFAEKYWENVTGNLLDSAMVINNIPIVKDVVATLMGDTPVRSDMQGIQDIAYAITEIAKSKRGDSKYTPQYVAIYALEHASKITGLPTGNIIREVRTISDTLVHENGSQETDYKWLKAKYDMRNTDNLNLYASMMIEARRSGNAKLEAQIKKDLNEAKIDNDTIGKRIKKLIKAELITDDSVHPMIDAAAQAVEEENNEVYKSAIKELVAEGYSQELVSSAVDMRRRQLRGEEEIDWNAEDRVNPDDFYEDVLGNTAEDEESEIEIKSKYSNADLKSAVKKAVAGDKDSYTEFNTVVKVIYDTKLANGADKKKIPGTIKSVITGEYKDQWIDAYMAGDTKKCDDIQNKLKQLKVNGSSLYDGDDWTSWRKAAKEKQKEEKKK